MSDILSNFHFPQLLTQFIITTTFSFIIGLELHSYRRANGPDLGFGTTRTFTLIGVAGFASFLRCLSWCRDAYLRKVYDHGWGGLTFAT
mgnify:CR=1 FL=1